MRLRTLLALIVVLVLGTAGTAAAQTPGTAELIFTNGLTGFGPAQVSVADATDTEVVVNLGIVGEPGEARTTLPAGVSYVVRVASPDALDQQLAVSEPLELVAGNRYVITAVPVAEGDGIGFTTYQSDPIQGGNLRVEHRTGTSEILQVNVRNGDADYDVNFFLYPGTAEDLEGLPNGRYGVGVTRADGQSGGAIDNLPVVAGQWTVVTVVADRAGIDLNVTGPGPRPSPSPAPSASPSPSPTAIRTPTRIETGAGGAAPDPAGRPDAVLVALGLLTGAAALLVRRVRGATTAA